MISKYLVAVSWFILSLIISVFNDSVVKYIGLKLPFAEVTFFRFLFGSISLIPVILYKGRSCLATSRISIHIIRGLILFIAINMWSWGINIVAISTVTVMSFTVPMFVLILAPMFLKEKVGFELWLTTVIGFIGIYIILNPHDVNFNINSLVLIIASLLFAILDVINKKFVVKETIVGMLFYSALITTIAGIYPAYSVWVTPSFYNLSMLMLLGIGGNLILFFILKAFELSPASQLSPYRYLELIFSIMIGYLVFNEKPSAHAYIGCAIIIPTSFYIARKNLSK